MRMPDLQSFPTQPEDLAAMPAVDGEGASGEQITHSGLDPSTDGGEGSEVLFAPTISATALAESAPADGDSLPNLAAVAVEASFTEGGLGLADFVTAQVDAGIGD